MVERFSFYMVVEAGVGGIVDFPTSSEFGPKFYSSVRLLVLGLAVFVGGRHCPWLASHVDNART